MLYHKFLKIRGRLYFDIWQPHPNPKNVPGLVGKPLFRARYQVRDEAHARQLLKNVGGLSPCALDSELISFGMVMSKRVLDDSALVG